MISLMCGVEPTFWQLQLRASCSLFLESFVHDATTNVKSKPTSLRSLTALLTQSSYRIWCVRVDVDEMQILREGEELTLVGRFEPLIRTLSSHRFLLYTLADFPGDNPGFSARKPNTN
jgi:hypothetical protein